MGCKDMDFWSFGDWWLAGIVTSRKNARNEEIKNVRDCNAMMECRISVDGYKVKIAVSWAAARQIYHSMGGCI